MVTRLRRSEQVERNRDAVLAAARQVFLDKGYAGATLDGIAAEAGFSKGVVYSQFRSKADLFLALLERRIAERAEQQDEVAERAGLDALLELAAGVTDADPAWALLVVEFRAHAARDPEVNRRYAEAHARTVERLTDAIRRIHERAGTEPRHPPRLAAEMILALASGRVLERAADPAALPVPLTARMVLDAIS